MAVWNFRRVNWSNNFSGMVRRWSPMKKTCGSYLHEYSHRTCREMLRRIQPTSEKSGTKV